MVVVGNKGVGIISGPSDESLVMSAEIVSTAVLTGFHRSTEDFSNPKFLVGLIHGFIGLVFLRLSLTVV